MPRQRLVEQPVMVKSPESEEKLRQELVSLDEQWKRLLGRNVPRVSFFGKISGLPELDQEKERIQKREKEIREKLRQMKPKPTDSKVFTE